MNSTTESVFTFMILAPLISALCSSFIDEKEFHKNIKMAFIWTTLSIFILSSGLLAMFKAEQSDYRCSFLWLSFSVSGISIYFIELTSILMLATALIAQNEVHHNVKRITITALLLEFFLFLLFSTENVFMFFLLLLAIALLVFHLLMLSLKESVLKMRTGFFYILFGTLFAFLGVIYLIAITHVTEIETLAKHIFTIQQQYIVFIIFFVTFTCISIVFPAYIWVSGLHKEIHRAFAIILFGITFFTGIFGIVTLLLRIAPKACLFFQPIIFLFSFMVMAAAAIFSIFQTELSHIIPGIFIFHSGISIFGLFSRSSNGISGALFNVIAVGLSVAALLMVSHIISNYYENTNEEKTHVQQGSSMLHFLSLFPLLTVIFTPLLPCFIGEFFILYGCMQHHFVLSVILGLMTSTSVFFSFKIYGKLFLEESSIKKIALTKYDLICLAPVIALIFAMGLFPVSIINSIEVQVSKNLAENESI